MSLPTNPLNRKEAYLNAIATGNTVDMPAKPITREEAYLDAIAKNGGGSGGAENYAQLSGKPQINNVELASGNNSLSALGIASESAVNGIKDGQSINSFSAVETALGNKVDKVEGKGLSTNDYSDTEKGKVADNTAAIDAIVNVNGCCNILQNNLTTRDFGGADLTVNADKSITIDGTPNVNNPQVALCDDYTLKAGTYTLSTGLATNSNLYMYIYDVTHNVAIGITYQEEGGKATFTLNSDSVVRPLLAIFATSTISNETVYPMLYDARLNPSDYVPYSMTNRELTERFPKRPTRLVGIYGAIYQHGYGLFIPYDSRLYGTITPDMINYIEISWYQVEIRQNIRIDTHQNMLAVLADDLPADPQYVGCFAAINFIS